MKCSACNQEIQNELDMVLITCDGDFVCNKVCEKKWYKDMKRFYDVIMPDNTKFEQWLKRGIE